MKKYFATTNAYNLVLFVDDAGKAFYLSEAAFDEELTLEAAKAADYSNFDGCETAEECAACYGFGSESLTEFDADEYESLTEF